MMFWKKKPVAEPKPKPERYIVKVHLRGDLTAIIGPVSLEHANEQIGKFEAVLKAKQRWARVGDFVFRPSEVLWVSKELSRN